MPLPDDPTRFDRDPTPEEIRQACRAIRWTWAAKGGGRPDPDRPPSIRIVAIAEMAANFGKQREE